MNQYNNNLNNSKSLPELFKEIQDIRSGRVEAERMPNDNKKEKIKFNKIYVVDKRFNAAGAIIGILFIILFFMSIQNNYIFATTEEEKIAINTFEENNNEIDIMNTISSNISELTTKEIITKQVEIDYETSYIDNSSLPKGEETVVQAGKFGSLTQTIIKTYENEELVSEKIISEVVNTEPTEEIIERGTSEFLANRNVHIGDTLYTTEQTYIYDEASIENEPTRLIYEYIDVELLSESGDWCYISVDGINGYIQSDYLTSETVTPGITELSRVKRLKLSLSFDMEVNKPSGLTNADFTKILSGHSSDVNHIFEDNAGLFYDIEQKYNVNGVFLAAMGIHESNWGTSSISVTKKNLFGYGAYDSSAYTSAYTFESYQYGIELVAKVLSKYYLNEAGTEIYDGETAVGSYYNGATISGVNVRYASDTNWANRVYSIMEDLYENL